MGKSETKSEEWEDGAALLRAYMKEKGFTYEVMAELLGITKGTLNTWLKRKNRPRFHMVFILQKLTHIHPARWLSEEEREEVDIARKAIDRLRRMRVTRPLTVVDKVAGKL